MIEVAHLESREVWRKSTSCPGRHRLRTAILALEQAPGDENFGPEALGEVSIVDVTIEPVAPKVAG